MKQRTFTKQQYIAKLKQVLDKKSLKDFVGHYKSDLTMMQHIYSTDDFLKGLDYIGEYLEIDVKDDIYKGFVFMLGVAVLNDLFIAYLNEETV